MIGMKNYKYSQGFTIIEILVTLVISAILLGGTINVLINNFNLSRANDRYARINENTLIAANFLTQELNNAGYTGCPQKVNAVANTGNPGDLLHLTDFVVTKDQILSVDGYDNASQLWSRYGSSQLQANIVNGTDAITIRTLLENGTPLLSDMDNRNSPLNVNLLEIPINIGELMAVYDCRQLDITQVTDVDQVNNNISHIGLTKAFTANDSTTTIMGDAARVSRFNAVRFYIGQDANGQAGLWREVLPGNTAESRQELIKGVEDMQILYGIASSGLTPDAYLTASQMTTENHWDNLVSIKFALLVTSNFVSTGGDDSLQNEEDNQDFLDYKNAQIALGAQHVLLDKNVPWVADNVIRRVVTREVFFRNLQYKKM